MDNVKVVALPQGFNPADSKHMSQLEKLVEAKAPGYGVFRVEMSRQRAVLLPKERLTVGGDNRQDTFRFDTVGAQNVVKLVASMEEKNPGESVISVDMTSGLAVMQRLDDSTLYARRQLSAALGLHPWDIRVFRTQAKGWLVKLPDRFAWQDSRYGNRVQEAVTQIGEYGWYYTVDSQANMLTVIPSQPPTFPVSIPQPVEARHPSEAPRRVRIGMRLPKMGHGETDGEPLILDFKDAPGLLVAGASNGGKSVILNNIIYGFLAGGGQLLVVNEHGKGMADFARWGEYLHEKGRGFDGLESVVATLTYVLEETQVRAKILEENGVANWWELPASVREEYPLWLLVADEIAQYAVPPKKIQGEKDSPAVLENSYEIMMKSLAYQRLAQVSKTARYTGICFVYATQQPNQQNGIDPSIRNNLSNRILVGAKVADNIRDAALNDPKSAPRVPGNVVDGGRATGAAVAEIVNTPACVFKAFYEDSVALDGSKEDFTSVLLDRLHEVREPVGDGGAWSEEDIMQYVPQAADRPVGVVTPRLRAGKIETEPVEDSSVDLSDGRGLRTATSTAEYMGLLSQAKGM